MPAVNGTVSFGKLGLAVRLICLDFLVSANFEIPREIRWGKKRVAAKQNHQTSPVPGVMVAAEIEQTSASSLLNDLEAAGYELANAYPFTQANGRKSVRFVLKHRDGIEMTPEFRAIRSEPRGFLGYMVTTNLWRVREGYRNPFFDGGVQTPGESAIQINFDSRISAGDVPATHALVVQDNELRIVEKTTQAAQA